MHRSRMSLQEKTRLEGIARPIAREYVRRGVKERELASAQSFMPVLRDVLQRGCFASGSPTDSVRMTATQQWLVQVAWALREVGDQLTQDIVLARLTRGQRLRSSSWNQIAADVSGGELHPDRAAAIYEVALPAFVRIIEERSITWRVTSESPVSQRYAPVAASVA